MDDRNKSTGSDFQRDVDNLYWSKQEEEKNEKKTADDKRERS